MKSVILTKYGAPEVLKVQELKDVEPLNLSLIHISEPTRPY